MRSLKSDPRQLSDAWPSPALRNCFGESVIMYAFSVLLKYSISGCLFPSRCLGALPVLLVFVFDCRSPERAERRASRLVSLPSLTAETNDTFSSSGCVGDPSARARGPCRAAHVGDPPPCAAPARAGAGRGLVDPLAAAFLGEGAGAGQDRPGGRRHCDQGPRT